MKCIRYAEGPPARVSDEDAAMLVAKGLARYVPRSEWKRETRDAK